MSYRKLDILKAFAIVHIFETSKAIGRTDALAVLTDGAGISYGFSQFTHKSGSLKKVCTEYLRIGGTVGAGVIRDRLPNLQNAAFISRYSKDEELKNALRAAGKTDLMRIAQETVAMKYYMQPSVDAAEGSKFTLPLSLAVIYDSNNQGGYASVRDKVTVRRADFTSDLAFEKAWITSFCLKRRAWLLASKKPIVRKTIYRPEFFTGEIGCSNWNLNFPMTVHGHKLKADDLPDTEEMIGSTGPDDPRNGPNIDPALIEEDSAPDDTTSATQELAKDPTERPTEDFNTGADTNTAVAETDDATAQATGEGTQTASAALPDGTKTESTSFNPQTIPQYIPKITEAKTWLGTITGGSFISVWVAQFAGLPDWAKVLFGAILGVGVVALVFVLWKHRADVFALVNKVTGINANPTQNNISLYGDKERYRTAVDKTDNPG